MGASRPQEKKALLMHRATQWTHQSLRTRRDHSLMVHWGLGPREQMRFFFHKNFIESFFFFFFKFFFLFLRENFIESFTLNIALLLCRCVHTCCWSFWNNRQWPSSQRLMTWWQMQWLFRWHNTLAKRKTSALLVSEFQSWLHCLLAHDLLYIN